MAIELGVTLPDGQTYEYFKLDSFSTERTRSRDSASLSVLAQYQLYKDAVAFRAGAIARARVEMPVVIDASSVTRAADALESLVDSAVIAAGLVLTVQEVAFDTSTGLQVS